MKKLNKLSARIGMFTIVAMTSITNVFAAGTADALNRAVQPVAQLIYDLLNPMLVIVGAVGALYCVVLGVRYSKSEEPQEREKAKGNLKNAIIGFVLIFVLMVLLKLLMPVLIDWVNANMKNVSNPTIKVTP